MITLDKLPKKCLSCRNEYIQRSIRQKYCGSRAKKIGCSYFIKKQSSLEYTRKNKTRLKILNKEWSLKNRPRKEKIIRTKEELRSMHNERNKKYYYKHHKRLMKTQTERHEYKRKNDVGYRLMCNMRLRLWIALKGKQKKDKTLKMIGCTLQELKSHIENQFKNNMTWENYGRKGWTIDHIKPLSKFDLSSFEEQTIAFHYTNLQPLWEIDNSRKSNKYVII